jgi:hypothetical protein
MHFPPPPSEEKNSSPLLENITQDSNGLGKFRISLSQCGIYRKKEEPVWIRWNYYLYPFCKKKTENDSIRLLMSYSHDLMIHLLCQWPERAPSHQSGMGGVKGHNIKWYYISGKLRPMAGELPTSGYLLISRRRAVRRRSDLLLETGRRPRTHHR